MLGIKSETKQYFLNLLLHDLEPNGDLNSDCGLTGVLASSRVVRLDD